MVRVSLPDRASTALALLGSSFWATPDKTGVVSPVIRLITVGVSGPATLITTPLLLSVATEPAPLLTEASTL